MTSGFNHWHFLCIQRNGIAGTVTYFYDGYAVDSKIQNEKLKTQLPPGKNFSIGLGDGTGKLTQLNIWDYEIATGSVVAMSSGGFNVHGSELSWSSLAKYVPGANISWNSSIYLPGKTEDLNKFFGSPIHLLSAKIQSLRSSSGKIGIRCSQNSKVPTLVAGLNVAPKEEGVFLNKETPFGSSSKIFVNVFPFVPLCKTWLGNKVSLACLSIFGKHGW